MKPEDKFNLSRGLFKMPEFIKDPFFAQNADTRNIGLWALYNAFNLIIAGSVPSLKFATKPMPALESRIKARFGSFRLGLEKEFYHAREVEASDIQ